MRVVSDANPTLFNDYLILADENVGAGERQLGAIANDVGWVDYDIHEEHRLFFFEQDLEVGIVDGEYLQRPATLDSRNDSSVRLDHPSKWQSFRVYDSGICSDHVIWEFFAFGFTQNYQDNFRSNPVITGGTVRDSSLTPIIQAGQVSNALRRDLDGIRVELELFAAEVTLSNFNTGGLESCEDVSIFIDMTLRIAAADSPLLSFGPGGFGQQPPDLPDECPGVGDSGGTIELAPDGFSRDVFAVVEEVDVDVSGCGAFNGAFSRAFADSIVANTPRISRLGFLGNLVQDPCTLGIPEEEIRPCQCDNQCNRFSPQGPAYVGNRHVCHFLEPGAPCETDADCDAFYHEAPDQPGYSCQNVGTERICVGGVSPIRRGECWVQLEPDRINARPDGIEFVSIGTDDPQAALVLNDLDGDGVLDGSYSARKCDLDHGKYLSPTASPVLGTFNPPF